MKLNQIKEAHIIQAHIQQERMIVFVMQLLSEKVILFNQIKQAHDIKAQYWQKAILFF